MGRRKYEFDLTKQEKEFVYELTRTDEGKPSSQTEAYQRVYNATGKRATLASEASRIAARPQVKKAIAEIHRRQELDRIRKRNATYRNLQSQLWNLAQTAEYDRDRIAALRELRQMIDPKGEGDLATMANAYSKQELIYEIISRIHAMGGSPIDVTSVSSRDEDTPHAVEEHHPHANTPEGRGGAQRPHASSHAPTPEGSGEAQRPHADVEVLPPEE